MINQNILDELKCHSCDPNYVIAITDIKGETECNQESLTFTVLHIPNTKLEDIKTEDSIEKEFTVVSNLAVDDSELYYSKLNGYFSSKTKTNKENGIESVLDKTIEILETTLKDVIEVRFNNQYDEKPNIIINIDKNYENLYRSYSLEFLKEDNKYYGVNIYFKSLKIRTEYPKVSIISIENKKEEEE